MTRATKDPRRTVGRRPGRSLPRAQAPQPHLTPCQPTRHHTPAREPSPVRPSTPSTLGAHPPAGASAATDAAPHPSPRHRGPPTARPHPHSFVRSHQLPRGPSRHALRIPRGMQATQDNRSCVPRVGTHKHSGRRCHAMTNTRPPICEVTRRPRRRRGDGGREASPLACPPRSAAGRGATPGSRRGDGAGR